MADVHIEEDAVLMLPDARGIAGVELKVERAKLLSPDGSLENQGWQFIERKILRGKKLFWPRKSNIQEKISI